MKNDDELKNKNEQSRKLEEIKDAQAAMLLTDDEVGEVAGGFNKLPNLEHPKPRKPDTPLPIIGQLGNPISDSIRNQPTTLQNGSFDDDDAFETRCYQDKTGIIYGPFG